MDVSELLTRAGEANDRLAHARAMVREEIPWYRYDILGNLPHLDALLHGDNRDLNLLAAALPVADIGGADGDLSFMLEHELGWDIDLIDTAATNMNGLRGARALREHLGSRVRIEDIDLDDQFRLPRERYGLVFLLGILYHLQNPFLTLRRLAEHTRHCLLSTKIARLAGPDRTIIENLPVAYLVSPSETNNDPTNYWIFSATGLTRLVERAGWTILESYRAGDTVASDPATPEHDERMFMLLRSRI